MEYKIVKNEDVSVLFLEGSMGHDDSDYFEECIDKIFETGDNIVVDFTGVDFLNSVIIGVLVSGIEKFKMANKEAVVSNIHDEVADIFDLIGINNLVEVFENHEAAIHHIHEKTLDF